MDAKLGHETDALTFLLDVAKEPYRYDFYQTLRRLECLYDQKPRWGTALRPVDEPVRLGQDPDLSFAPAPLASLEFGKDGAPPRLQVRLFGMLGPNGPLPIHLTEYVRHRLRHASDPTLSRFLDMLHHRFIALLYRAWAQAQPHVNRDRAGDDHYLSYVGTFIGIAPGSLRDRDTVPDLAKLFHVGTLVRQVVNKINEIDFNRSEDRHLFGDIYEQILRDLQNAGNAAVAAAEPVAEVEAQSVVAALSASSEEE